MADDFQGLIFTERCRLIRNQIQQNPASRNALIEREAMLLKEQPVLLENGKYILQRRLGGGAQADVFIAIHRKSTRANGLASDSDVIEHTVVAKIIDLQPGFTSSHDDLLSTFRREIKTSLQLEGHGVAGIKDWGETDIDGAIVPFIIQEYIEHAQPIELYAKHNPHPPAYWVNLCIKIGDILLDMHNKGVAHLDVHSGNVLIRTDRDEAMPVLVDLGLSAQICKLNEEGMPEFQAEKIGGNGGTLPEQILSDTGNAPPMERRDAFGMALLLWRLLSGAPPPKVLKTANSLVLAARLKIPASLIRILRPSLADDANKWPKLSALQTQLKQWKKSQQSFSFGRIALVAMGGITFAVVLSVLSQRATTQQPATTGEPPVSPQSSVAPLVKNAPSEVAQRYRNDTLREFPGRLSRLQDSLGSLRSYPDAEIRRLVQKSLNSAQNNQLRTAQSSLEQALQLATVSQPSDPIMQLDSKRYLAILQGGIAELSAMQMKFPEAASHFMAAADRVTGSFTAIQYRRLAGRVFFRAGNYPAAAEAQRKSLQLLHEMDQQHSDLAGRVQVELGESLLLGECFEAAGEQFLALRQNPGASAASRVRADSLYVDVLRSSTDRGTLAQQVTKAVQVANDAIALAKEKLPANHEELAGAHNAMVKALIARAAYPGYPTAYKEAVYHGEIATVMRKKTLGPDHPDVSNALINLGVAQKRHWKLKTSLQTLHDAVQVAEASYGKHHLVTGYAYLALSSSYQELGKKERAEHYSKKMITALVEDDVGPRGYLSAIGYSRAARTALRFEQPDIAARLAEMALPFFHDRLVEWMAAHVEYLLAKAVLGTEQSELQSEIQRTAALWPELNGILHPIYGEEWSSYKLYQKEKEALIDLLKEVKPPSDEAVMQARSSLKTPHNCQSLRL